MPKRPLFNVNIAAIFHAHDIGKKWTDADCFRNFNCQNTYNLIEFSFAS